MNDDPMIAKLIRAQEENTLLLKQSIESRDSFGKRDLVFVIGFLTFVGSLFLALEKYIAPTLTALKEDVKANENDIKEQRRHYYGLDKRVNTLEVTRQ